MFPGNLYVLVLGTNEVGFIERSKTGSDWGSLPNRKVFRHGDSYMLAAHKSEQNQRKLRFFTRDSQLIGSVPVAGSVGMTSAHSWHTRRVREHDFPVELGTHSLTS